MANATKTVNHLNRMQQRKVEDWLIANWKEVEKKRMTKDEVTALILKDESVDFRITPQNVRSSAKALGYKWPRPKPTGGGFGPRYRETIYSLIDVAEALCKEWDMEVPPIFAKFKEGGFKGYKAILTELALVMRTLTSAVGADFPEDLQLLCDQAAKKSQTDAKPTNPK